MKKQPWKGEGFPERIVLIKPMYEAWHGFTLLPGEYVINGGERVLGGELHRYYQHKEKRKHMKITHGAGFIAFSVSWLLENERTGSVKVL